MRRILAGTLLAGMILAACRGTDSPTAPAPAQGDVTAAPAQMARYIVVYKPSVTDTRAEMSRNITAQGARVSRIYQYALRGWAGDLTPGEVARLRQDPHVAFLEKDQRVHADTTELAPSWGLDRIDQVSLPLNSKYGFATNGAGVHFYGIDTGILYSHTDFGGRASPGFDAITPSTNAKDCAGHGTHTASTAAGTTYGVAKGMTIIGVRVLDCTGSGAYSEVIAGVDWVTQNAIKPAVANMSLGGPKSAALDLAVANSIASGVVYAIASGNGDIFGNPQDACGFSPADVATAITVNASAIDDSRAFFSNYGTCTDIYAPGLNITAAWFSSNTATNTISGTSMATPHVAGVVGLYLQLHPTDTPAQVAAALIANASSGKITNPLANTPNLLLSTVFLGGGSVVNLPPRDSITAPGNNASFVQGASVSFAGGAFDLEDGSLTGASLVWTSSRDGQIGTGNSFSRSNLSVGAHTITLTAKDSQNLPATAVVTITITPASGNQPPVADFTVNCPALQCTFNGGTSTDDVGVVSYAWTWGNGSGETKTVPTTKKTYAAAGTYNVTLKVTDGGGLSSSITKAVQVPTPASNQPPTAAISQPTNNASFVQGASVTFAGTGNDPETGALTGAALVWTSSRDGQIGTGTGFSTTTLSVGTHTITLTATDPQSSTGTATRTITVTAPVDQPPTAVISQPTNNASFVQGTSVTFAGTGNDPETGALTGTALVWTSSRDGQIGTGIGFSTTTLSVGTHTITLTATDPHGSTGTATLSVTITAPSGNQPPVANFTFSCPTLQCSFNASSSTDDVGVVKYLWLWGDTKGENHPFPSIKHTYAASGTYTVLLRVTDGGGLTSIITKQVSVP